MLFSGMHSIIMVRKSGKDVFFVEENRNEEIRPVNPRRRKRTRWEIFRDAYLPVVIAGVAVILILVFLVGSIVRAVQRAKYNDYVATQESIYQAEQEELRKQQAAELMAQADLLAAGYDYQGAIDLLRTFEGEPTQEITDRIAALEAEKEQLVEWKDPSQIPNLSFQLLIADTGRAFGHSVYGTSFNRNFVTTEEFAKILQQLYENGYVLVNREDVWTVTTAEDGTASYAAKPILLPNGKKPLMITQTNVNYNLYLIDGDGDKLPDQYGGGFASKLVYEDGKFTCEMVDAAGETVSGDFDLVPILEKFISNNPGFSYQGARATLALTGYNGLFGYRTNPATRQDLGETAYESAVEGAKKIVDALRKAGYELAFYTYENIGYGEKGVPEIQLDLTRYKEEMVPILGKLDTIVFAQNSDIAAAGDYSGEKFDLLKSEGFTQYVGFSTEGTPWSTNSGSYIRQGRIMVSGSTMAHRAQWFAGMFDTEIVLDLARGEVPEP